MKRIGWLVLLLASAGPGCIGLKQLGERKEEVVEPPPPPPARPGVAPEDVNEANYAAKAEELEKELRREGGHVPGPLEPRDTKR